jgi:hypothetical protein
MFNLSKALTEEEVMTSRLLPKGDYPFVVKACQQKISKSGNPMIEVQLSIKDDNGREHLIFDYLMESVAFKLRHFFVAVGMEDDYMSGTINPAKAIGRSGIAKLFIQEDKNKIYGPKNAVQDYSSMKESAPKDKIGELNDPLPW